MAKSKARKYRDKLAREGNRNPDSNRSPFASIDMRTRKTKTKKDHMYQHKYKNHSFPDGYDGSFYFIPISSVFNYYISIMIYIITNTPVIST